MPATTNAFGVNPYQMSQQNGGGGFGGFSGGNSAGPGGFGNGASQVYGGGGGANDGTQAYGSVGTGFGGSQSVNFAPSMVEVNRENIQKTGQQLGLQEAQIAADAQKYPATLAMQRFNTVWPFLQNQFGSAGGAAGAGAAGQFGNGSQPRINTSPVWNPQQIQQQINTSNAATDASTQSQQRQLANSLGGQGYGANSPLAAALGVGMQSQGLQTKTANETGIRNNAAQVNANQVFSEQQAASNQYAQRQQESLQQQQILASQRNALLAALSGLAH